MNNHRESRNELNSRNEHLAKTFLASGRYNPAFLAIFLAAIGIGFFVIYLLTVLGVFGQPAPQLIFIGILTSLLAAAQIPILSLARRNRGITAYMLGSIAVGVFAILLTFFWQGILPLAILLTIITPIAAVRAGLPGRYILLLAVILTAIIAGIYYVDRNTEFARLQNSTPAAIASFAFLIATGLLLITITVISGNKTLKHCKLSCSLRSSSS